MKYIKLGKTGIEVSLLGMGGHEYLPGGKGSRGFNEDFSLATTPGHIFDGFGDKSRLDVLKAAFELGINFFDVTMDSEKEAIGRNLKEIAPPYEIFIQTRPEGMVYTYDKYNLKMADLKILRNEALRILKLIKRDSIDFFNIAPMRSAFEHDPDYLEKVGYNIGELKKEGLIRFACADTFSGQETYLKMINSGHFDIVYINFNLGDCKALEKVFPLAREKGMGVVVREIFMKGQLFKMANEAEITDTASLADAALKWCFSHGLVDMVIYGTQKVPHLKNAVNAVSTGILSEADVDLIDKIKSTQLFKDFEAKKTDEFLLHNL